jgi:flagellar basal-body rod modification protein FlgD
MNTIDALNAVGSTTSTTPWSAANRLPVQTLGQDDFLKLLVAQLSAQDPMNPQKDTEFVAQMAQFSALEQSRAMQSDMAGLRTEQQVLQANAMIGRTVALQDGAGNIITGVVSGLLVENGTPQMVVNGQPYPLSQLLGVTDVPPTT